MCPKAKLSLTIFVAIMAVIGAVIYYTWQRTVSESIAQSLTADGRFISSAWQQYALEHPEIERIGFEEFLKAADAEYGGREQWVSWDNDATYEAALSQQGGVITMTHPKVPEPIHFTY
ncbi:hypothetical protein [Cerasicoccus fimbriatus]|uniref:hypothetical protein n=1 Tax=Cerasicoccus fimbriatus TaxID=3014554 RepID=UPI0022B3B120|nr:hypothetical protein [Cerasicoccus sp. TK19100]